MKFIGVFFLMVMSYCVNAQTTFQKTIQVDNGKETAWNVLVEDDGYLICATGSAQVYNGWKAIKLFKTDFNGDLEWYKFHGKISQSWFSGYNGSFIKTQHGGYAVGAAIYDSITGSEDAALIKFDQNGDTTFVKIFGGSFFDAFRHCRQTPDGGFVMEGETQSFGDPDGDFYLVKTDSSGEFEWQKTYGGSELDRATFMEVTPDSGYILSGPNKSFGPGVAGAYIVKADKDGNLEWDTTFGTSGTDLATAITITKDGDYLVWGSLDTIIDIGDAQQANYVGKLDKSGNVVWWQFFNSPKSRNIWQLREVGNGDIMFIGESYYEPLFINSGWLVRMNRNGDVVWEREYLFTQDSINYKKTLKLNGDVQQTPDGGFVMTGLVRNLALGNIQEILLMKVDSNGCLENDCGVLVGVDEPMLPQANVKVYPNPATDKVIIEFTTDEEVGRIYFDIYDLAGVRKKAMIFDKNQVRVSLNIRDLPSGMYLYTFRSQKKQLHSGKFAVNNH